MAVSRFFSAMLDALYPPRDAAEPTGFAETSWPMVGVLLSIVAAASMVSIAFEQGWL